MRSTPGSSTSTATTSTAAGLDVRGRGARLRAPRGHLGGAAPGQPRPPRRPRPTGAHPLQRRLRRAPLELWGWQNGATWLDWGARRVSFATPEGPAPWPGWPRTRGLGNAAGVPEAQQAVSRRRRRRPALAHPSCAPPSASASESTRLVSTVASWHPGFPLGYVEPPGARAPPGLTQPGLGYALHRDAPDVAWEALTFLLAERAVLAGARRRAPGPHRAPSRSRVPAPLRPLPTPGRALWFPLQRAADHRRAAGPSATRPGARPWTRPATTGWSSSAAHFRPPAPPRTPCGPCWPRPCRRPCKAPPAGGPRTSPGRGPEAPGWGLEERFVPVSRYRTCA